MSEIIDATNEHIAAIIPRLRKEDVAEAIRFGRTIEDALAYTMAHSPYRKAWFADGQLACLFGVGVTDVGHKALPWLWATDLIRIHIKEFVRIYHAEFETGLRLFPCVQGMIAERYMPYMKWLEHRGVKIGAPVWNEQAQTNFYPYEMTR